MHHFKLVNTEVQEIDLLLAEALRFVEKVDLDTFLIEATVWAHQLPRRLRECLNRFRLEDAYDGTVIVSGLEIDDHRIGPTPGSLELSDRSRTRREEAYLMLLAVLLGDLIAWATQQAGQLIHDLFPIKQHQDLQLGTGCRQLLTWHTEDAFHPLRGDYLAMLCLRNPERVATTIASIEDVELDQETKRWLFQPCYTILPDESHRGITGVVDASGEAATGISRMLQQPEKVPVLFGHPAQPYLRLDPYFMPLPEEESPRRALQALINELDTRLLDVALQPGDVCILDNFRVVHGRRPFQARFDGTDRWLKRVLVSRDLRKSLTARGSVTSRVIH